tara:strand:- start:205 stop:357 length:153 start_codon:yes stop_codon:yes gene_type:complete
MKKSILIAVAIALVLGIFGYFLSTAGHDHSKHGGEGNHHETHMEGEEHHH